MASEKKIGDRLFRVNPLLATDALLLQAKLFKVLGPGIRELGGVLRAPAEGEGPTGLSASKEDMARAAIAAFSAIFASAKPEEVVSLVKEVVQIAQVRRPSGVYDNVDFDGDLTGHGKDIPQLVMFVLKEQFGDFFGGLPGSGSLGKMLNS